MFWRRGRRDEGDTGRQANRGELNAEIEAELGADAEPADLDEAAGGAGESLDDIDFDEDASEAEEPGSEAEEPGSEPDDVETIEGMTPEEIEAQGREFMAENDTWMYGAAAPAILALLDRLEDVGPFEAEAVIEASREVSKGEREVARKAIRRLTETDEEAERHVRLAREAVGNWLAVAGEDLAYQAEDGNWPRHAAQVAEVAIDAASALVVRPQIDEFDFEALHAPWERAVAAWDAAAAQDSAEAEAEDDEEADAEEADSGEFGPNTREVKELLSRLWLLPPDQVSRLVSNWEQTPRDDLQRAHAELREVVAESDEFRRQVRKAQRQLEPWLNSGRREETSAYLGRSGTADTHSSAGPTLADAVAALVLGDLLEPDTAQTLYAPWFKLVGAPPLPEPSESEAGGEPADTDATSGDSAGAGLDAASGGEEIDGDGSH